MLNRQPLTATILYFSLSPQSVTFAALTEQEHEVL